MKNCEFYEAPDVMVLDFVPEIGFAQSGLEDDFNFNAPDFS